MSELKKTISEAKALLDVAEHDLEKLLDDIKSAPRADKMMISNALTDAFEKLALAKKKLEAAEAAAK